MRSYIISIIIITIHILPAIMPVVKYPGIVRLSNEALPKKLVSGAKLVQKITFIIARATERSPRNPMSD
jgi:hypothetical protein